jgi:hypothetical protein
MAGGRESSLADISIAIPLPNGLALGNALAPPASHSWRNQSRRYHRTQESIGLRRNLHASQRVQADAPNDGALRSSALDGLERNEAECAMSLSCASGQQRGMTP